MIQGGKEGRAIGLGERVSDLVLELDQEVGKGFDVGGSCSPNVRRHGGSIGAGPTAG